MILGMNWLVKYYATIECWKKRVRFDLPGEDLLYFQCEKRVSSLLINSVRVNRYMKDGELVFLAKLEAKLEAINEVIGELSAIPMVNEFIDVFLEEIVNLPPEREIKFYIDVQPGMTPIVKTPYRMTTKELLELKN